MRLKFIIPWLLAALAATSLSAQMKPTFAIEGDGVGYVLLNDVVQLFSTMATGDEFRGKVLLGLDRSFVEARLAREKKLIDAAFLDRFHRVLLVLKLVILKSDAGKGVSDPIVDSLLVREMNRFDIAEKPAEGTAFSGIGSVAGFVAEELLSLKKYLDQFKGQPVS
jgi:hypothetical protein